MDRYKKTVSVLLAFLIVLGTLTTVHALAAEESTSQSLPFTDVSNEDWFFGAAQYVYRHEIMTGISATSFAPNAPFTRAMVVATLFRIYHGRTANASDWRLNPFTDVSSEQWFAPYVAWAHMEQIVEGVGTNRFAPNDRVDRQQFATMLHRYAYHMTEKDTQAFEARQWSLFTDRDQTADWARAGLVWANHQAIITGRTLTSIVPEGIVTRAGAATMLMRFHLPPHGLAGERWTISHYMLDEDEITRPWTNAPYSLFFGAGAVQHSTRDFWRTLFQTENNQLIGVSLWNLEDEALLTYHPESSLLQYTFFCTYSKMPVHHFFTRTIPLETNLRIEFATQERLNQLTSYYEFIESEEAGGERLVITTDRTIWDVTFRASHFGQAGTSLFIKKLTPETGLVITGMDWYAMDYREILFTDANGFRNPLAVYQRPDGSFGLEFRG